MNTIPLSQHPHNLDRTAKIVWEDRRTGEHVYSVKAGYVAAFGHSETFDTTFQTEEDARDAMRRNGKA